jgi:hypothetical protein
MTTVHLNLAIDATASSKISRSSATFALQRFLQEISYDRLTTGWAARLNIYIMVQKTSAIPYSTGFYIANISRSTLVYHMEGLQSIHTNH